jgi:5'-phosphate synthase pdxT subunit
MLKFIERQGLKAPLVEFGKSKPVWGICAGAILIAKEVQNPTQMSLGLIDIRATRNFYGSQLDSFTKDIQFPLLEGKQLTCHFIRAPMLSPLDTPTRREKLHTLAEVDGVPVFFAQGSVWACSFHVELGNNPALHEAFLAIPRNRKSAD